MKGINIKMKRRRNTSFILILIILVIIVTGIISVYFQESIANSITVVTAGIGAIAIWYQLKKDHDISKAEFIISLNNTFHENKNIEYIYNKLKQYRDIGNVTFTEDDGRRMGDYIMYFEIMNYLVDEEIVTIEMVNKLFSNKFFIFVNNQYVQDYQLVYNALNKPVLELYTKWYNYRVSNGECMLYPKTALHLMLKDYFIINNKGFLNINPNIVVNYE